ncbi:MAG: hypothetical protein ACP5GD_01165 [Candidatus Micrarchaeia archaeon]|jgi:hypothetical protein
MKAQLATFETAIGVGVFLAVAAYVWSNAYALAEGTISSAATLDNEAVAYDVFNFLRHNATAQMCLNQLNEACITRLLIPFSAIYFRHFSIVLNGTIANGACDLIDGKIVCLSV